MFSLASRKLFNRRILVVENETEIASTLLAAVLSEGGLPLGPVADVEDALRYVADIGQIDSIILDTRMAGSTHTPIPDLFRERGIDTIFVTGHDDWFDGDDDDNAWEVCETRLATA